MLRIPLALTLVGALVISAAAGAAPPDVPARINYQGVLLDDLGQPRTGPIDLTVRIHDGLLGSAVLLYRQDFAAVPLNEGVFSILIGPAGEATDTPTDPLTTSLEAVFAGDLVAGPDRFIELTVAGDTAQTRVQILSSPLAIRAKSADTAATADTATSATSVVSINGLDPIALNEIFEHFDFDGGNPPNDDPSEGTVDVDGDGIANFIDPDNDGDGIADVAELSQGSDINLVTPTVTDVTPDVTDFGFPAPVTVTGTNFEPGLTVQFGTQSPTPSNVTATSFDVTVGPQAPDFFPDVTVTLPNGENDTASGLFEFSSFTPILVSASPSQTFDNTQVDVTVFGSNFVPGITVQFGTENPTPTNVTASSFEVAVGPQPAGFATITVTRPNGASGVGTELFEFREALQGTGFPHGSGGPISSFSVASSGASVVGDKVDLANAQAWTVDAIIDPISSIGGTFDLAYDDTDTLGGLIALQLGGACDVQVRRDANANGRLFSSEGTVVETFGTSSCEIVSPSLAYLSNGGGVAAYSRDGGELVIAADYNADDDWDDAAEQVVIAAIQVAQLDAATDPSDNVAVVWTGSTGAFPTRLLHDRNGDGDFQDASEDVVLPTSGQVACIGLAFDAAGLPGVIFQEQAATQVTLLHDQNGDGDFSDAGENQTFGNQVGGQCAITAIPTGFAVAHNANGEYRLLADLDGDDLFQSTGENVVVGPDTPGALNVDVDGIGRIFTATPDDVFISAP